MWSEEGPCWHVLLGHFRPSVQRRSLPLFLHHCPLKGGEGERERVGPALCTQPVRVGDFPLCVPSGPLALLQENSAAFQGRLRPCWKRVKEFGRPKKAWITAGGGRKECFEPTMLCHSALILMRRVYVCVGWVYACALTKSNKADKFVPVAMGISAVRGGVASCCFSA